MIRSFTSVLLTAALLLSACGGGTETAQTPPPVLAAAMPDLPTSEVNNAVGGETLDARSAWRLLDQATFGPRMQDVDALNGSSAEAWIDAQMRLPATYLSTTHWQYDTGAWNDFINAWWRMAIESEDQLRQRVAFALSEIFVVSNQTGLGAHQDGLTWYYDILLRHAFGNYRDLLEDVTLSPAMGEYLSMKGNRKADEEENIRADENYAREIMQLFSIGLDVLNIDGTPKLDENGQPIPTYDQSTIENFARVFTGWNFANIDNFRWPKREDYTTPMQLYPEFHDTGAKTLLNGLEIPAGMDGEAELQLALDNLFEHPNVGPFISKQLIQRLVTSNPSPEYVADVATVFNRNANGERGNLASVIKAILVHREARRGHEDGSEFYGKVREPVIQVTRMWRAFQPERIGSGFDYSWALGEIAQAPLSSQTVFNFFRPNYSQPGTLQLMDVKSPELQIINESSIVSITSRMISNALWNNNYRSGSSKQVTIDISRAMELEPNREALLSWLDLLMLGGTMSDVLREACNDIFDARSGSNQASQRVAEVIALIATAPESAIQY